MVEETKETPQPAPEKTNPTPEAKPVPDNPTKTAPVKQGGSNTAVIIIIIVVAVLVVLGLGGYFGWKFIAKKVSNLAGTVQTSTTPTATSTLSKTATPATTVTVSSTATLAASGDYIISDSSARVISESELTKLTPWQLKVARNEIYARHGRAFVHKDLQCFFAKHSWYKVDSNFSESSLTTTENKNVATILAYEQKTSSPLYQTDTGCNTNP